MDADWVDIDPDFDAYDDPVVAVNVALGEALEQRGDRFPLIFAADCCSCWGAMRGLQDQQPVIFWYDAHGDINTPETTPSGFLGGMPVAALIGRGNQHYVQEIGVKPVDEADVILVDGRDLDPGEVDLLRNSAVTHLKNVADVQSYGLPTRPVYLHLDTDVLNTEEMPAVLYPAIDGPRLSDVEASVAHVVANTQVAGILVTLWDHRLPGAEQSQATTLQLLETILDNMA